MVKCDAAGGKWRMLTSTLRSRPWCVCVCVCVYVYVYVCLYVCCVHAWAHVDEIPAGYGHMPAGWRVACA